MILAKNILVATIVNTCTKLLIGGKKTHSNKNMGKMFFFFFSMGKDCNFNSWENKDMFGNCFFLLFFIFKNNFLFLELKNLFGNSK